MKQNTKEWLDMRKNYLGASDAPIIMGISPWKTPYRLWQEKLGLSQEPEQNRSMQRGSALEPTAREAYTAYTGISVEPCVVFHPERKYLLASMDGLSCDKKHAVEIKCPGQKDHDAASQGKVPEKYFPQLQHQMAVCGLEMVHYWSFSENSQYLIEVPLDKKYLSSLYKEEENFWQCIQNFEPPKFTDRDFIHKEDRQTMEDLNKMGMLKASIDLQKTQYEEIRKRVIESADSQSFLCGDWRVQKIMRKGSVQYGKIPELKGVNIDKYRGNPVEMWRISK